MYAEQLKFHLCLCCNVCILGYLVLSPDQKACLFICTLRFFRWACLDRLTRLLMLCLSLVKIVKIEHAAFTYKSFLRKCLMAQTSCFSSFSSVSFSSTLLFPGAFLYCVLQHCFCQCKCCVCRWWAHCWQMTLNPSLLTWQLSWTRA